MSTCEKRANPCASNAEILSCTNPEIFETIPRPGGFVKVSLPSKSQSALAKRSPCPKTCARNLDSQSQVSIGSTHSRSSRVPAASYNPRTPSREFRISRAYPEWSDSEMEAEGMHDPVADSMSMLATTISCVMLLAAGVHQIPEEYYIWTERYLDCMRDPQMRYPPNILGILNHIEMLRKGKKDPPPTEKPCKQKDKKDSSARSPCPKTSPCAKTSKGISPDDSSIICDTGSQMRTSKI